MLSRKKIFSFGILFIICLMMFMGNTKVEANGGSPSQRFTGSYNGDISILYFYEDWWGDMISTDNRYSHNLNANWTNLQNYVFTANSLEIRGYDIHNGTGLKTIAYNDTAPQNITESYAVAQEFSHDDFYYVSGFRLYLNYSFLGYYHFIAAIVDENFTTEIDYYDYYVYASTPTSWAGWRWFWFYNNMLEPSTKYYFVFYVENITLSYFGLGPTTVLKNNYWKAELYNSTIYNKGDTLIYNSTHMNPILNDDTKDMLCEFQYIEILDPREIDLRIYINNQEYAYSTLSRPWGGGYEIYYKHSFPMAPQQPINVTITLNSTIQNMQIQLLTRYLYTIPAYGYYNATPNRIDWEIIYPHEYVDGAFGFPGSMFAFEYDWDYGGLYDPLGAPLSDIYFGPISYNNESYYAMFSLFMGPGLQPGNYSGRFTSPNYCHDIDLKVKGESGFQIKSSFELGETLKLEALIQDSANNPMSGGIGSINLTTPSGHVIYSETNLSATSGLLSTPEFYLGTDLETGQYTVTVFWTNGREVACYSTQIEARSPPLPSSPPLLPPDMPDTLPPTLPPPMQPTEPPYLVIGTLIALAAAAIPLASYTRRRMQMRNWEKHLQNLFVLSKDGRSIYGYTFGIEIQDPSLISAALMAITNFVTDAVKSKKQIKVIDLQDKKVILSHGNMVTTALIAAKDFPIILKRTEEFTQAFEKRYGGKVVGWRGDAQSFKGTDKLIQEFFPVSMEERITRGVKLKMIEVHERLESASDPEVLIAIMREITQLLSRYRNIIEEHYMDEYTKLMSIFDEKISES